MLVAAIPALADDQSAPPAPAEGSMATAPANSGPVNDPPGRVARLQYMTGSVSIQPRGVDDWVQGSANRPLTNADNVWADKDSRAELNTGTGLMQINSESSLTLANVDNNAVQVQLHQGTMDLHIKHLYGGEVYEIDTPNFAFTVTKSGDYRFDVDPNGDSSVVTVWKGEGEATGKGPAVKVKSGKQARFTGGNSMAYHMQDAPPPDGFDQWCQVRDQRADHSISARYVAPGVVGSEDLDQYGTWRETPEYGNVWVPASVAPGWAPYRYGHWVWVAPWGWTWVDDAPWGFAPFHYGRWVYAGWGWGWAPGPYWARPWYAPAMVGWFGGPGWGLGWGVGFGFGFGVGWGWGWAPLGWGEPFAPWWGRCSPGYFRNVNISNTHITNIHNVTNNYFHNGANNFYGHNGIANPRFATEHNGLTAASSNTLQHSLPVQNNMGKVPESALHNLPSAKGPAVSPTRESQLGSKAGQPAARPTNASAASRPTVSHMTPPAAPARTSGSETSASRGAENQTSHGAGTSSARNSGEGSANRAPESASRGAATPQSSARSATPEGRTGTSSNYVPRPPSAGGTNGNARGNEASRSEPTQMAMNRSVPRPPSSYSSSSRSMQGSTGTARSEGSTAGTRSYSSPSAGRGGGVPRPTGPVRSAPSNYASNGYGRSSGGGYGGFGSRGYGSSSGAYRGYGERPNYGSPNGGHYSAPSHSSGGYHGSSGGSHGGGSHGGGSHGGGSHGGGGGHR
jgi:hypothetical protein